MKKLLIVAVLLFGAVSFAQNKNARASFEVDGVCMMCKERIEKACIKSKGVKSAVWNVQTHELKLIFDERKTDLKTIKEKILSVGHDLKDKKATDEAYNNLHHCCKYRDEEILKNHQ
jgi:cation transport ATPase